jgi:MSHA pilin protein MshD
MVLVGIAFAGLLVAFNQFVKASVDPLIRKQALAIAESLLDEVALMPFTLCDPDDPNAAKATSPADCTGGAAASEDGTIGPEAGESRGSATAPFDNVSDYDGFSMVGIRDISGNAIPGLTAYSANIAVAQAGLSGIAANEALRITVTVTAPDGSTLALNGYRTRYAPRTEP